MRTQLHCYALLAWILAASHSSAWSQGFVNLDFESPRYAPAAADYELLTADALPGWAAYGGTYSLAYIFHNTISIGGGMVALYDTNASFPYSQPLQGTYSVYIEGGFYSPSFAVGQTGSIPDYARKLTFWASYPFQVSFAGQSIDCVPIGGTSTYTIYGADVSSLAGQTGELKFTAPSGGYNGLLDNIQFSSTPIPEPGMLSLVVVGAAVLLIRRSGLG